MKGGVALVTGASRGIGRATAARLVGRGFSLGLVARSVPDLEEVAATLGGRVAVAAADVADPAQVRQAVASIAEALGPIDVLVNNAGVGAYAAILEEDDETFERLMRVNYFGTLHAIRAVLPSMAERRRGHIVNVASIAGRVGAPFEAAYSASKFAVVGLSESLAAEMHAYGISVSLVNPGPVDTSFTDARGVPFQRRIPRPVAPERVADAVGRAIEHDAFEVTIPRWLRVGPITRALTPSLYRRGLLRDAAKESAALRDRYDAKPPGA